MNQDKCELFVVTRCANGITINVEVDTLRYFEQPILFRNAETANIFCQGIGMSADEYDIQPASEEEAEAGIDCERVAKEIE